MKLTRELIKNKKYDLSASPHPTSLLPLVSNSTKEAKNAKYLRQNDEEIVVQYLFNNKYLYELKDNTHPYNDLVELKRLLAEVGFKYNNKLYYRSDLSLSSKPDAIKQFDNQPSCRIPLLVFYSATQHHQNIDNCEDMFRSNLVVHNTKHMIVVSISNREILIYKVYR
jgi:hypothetical protein